MCEDKLKIKVFIIILIVIIIISLIFIITTNSKNKSIYLTIDDCPSPDFKEKVKYLIDNDIKATFFCVGSAMSNYKEDLSFAVSNGYDIENHSFSHPYFSKISLEEIKDEIYKTDKIITDIYKDANIERTHKFFREPYGDKMYFQFKKRKEVNNYLKSLGYTKPKTKTFTFVDLFYPKDVGVFWTANIKEYDFSEKKTLNRLEKILNKNKNQIILVHDHKRTTEVFYKIINKLLESKIEIKSL
ncbi:MAG: polysaccharide deacetylase family protein [archaeon]|jgi:peptidoglycan/xylan/chitin deacetylase (PgdA/CDA1 family)|nr:polysaccharide deacetylase family protein [archaeon]MDD2478024.1 polysaccharide deacetylase family protein [Candidatus ainarchaeum sp.]MDD3084793.1 polysaccharide deacetylase family protein [Candidatus ainarchaeum sp.]MDD4221353.1 polysaccharide deacetylase family protein [Candidatus ainarchaeum sp.]MDD4662648.1 polysaccharide deacetylase family protein [Candidatus ainarchaeum sp.]